MASPSKMVEQIVALLEDERPMHEIMRDDEVQRGHKIIVPGDRPWLSKEDWVDSVTVSQSGREIRLVAILATRPGNGAFRRTVTGILDAGLVPVVVAPTREMRETMQRWNWFPRHVGSGWGHEEQWRPRKGWRP